MQHVLLLFFKFKGTLYPHVSEEAAARLLQGLQSPCDRNTYSTLTSSSSPFAIHVFFFLFLEEPSYHREFTRSRRSTSGSRFPISRLAGKICMRQWGADRAYAVTSDGQGRGGNIVHVSAVLAVWMVKVRQLIL